MIDAHTERKEERKDNKTHVQQIWTGKWTHKQENWQYMES